MAKKKRHPEAVYFTDVSIVKNDHVLFTANYYALENSIEEKTAIISLKEGKWGGTNLQGIAHALMVDHINSKQRVIYVLDRNRAVYKLDSSIQGDWIRINESRNGFLMDLNKIGGDLYAVGGNHQIYHEVAGNWNAVDDGVYINGAKGGAKILTTIDGINKDNIYAAGMNGVILYYDGKRWDRLDVPTNVGIQKILCVSDKTVYACGYENLLMRGNSNGWEVLTELDDSIVYWDMCKYKDDIFMCSKTNIFRLSDSGFPIQEDINVERPLGFYRMDANQEQLWTVGNECVLKYDGKKWEQFKFPLNDL